MITPHEAFAIMQPDEMAECVNGILHNALVPDLYEQLWACVDIYETFNREDCGPHDVIGLNSIARFWGRFDETAQAELNRLITAHNDYITALCAGR